MSFASSGHFEKDARMRGRAKKQFWQSNRGHSSCGLAVPPASLPRPPLERCQQAAALAASTTAIPSDYSHR